MSADPHPARALKLEVYAWEDATVVSCSGRLTSETGPELKAEVKRLIPNKRRIVLDLTQLSYMDSSGLGAIVGLYVSCRNSGGLELINLSPRIRELLGITNVLSVFEACGRYGSRFA
jgi:anti-sigma B factor antagonist